MFLYGFWGLDHAGFLKYAKTLLGVKGVMVCT